MFLLPLISNYNRKIYKSLFCKRFMKRVLRNIATALTGIALLAGCSSGKDRKWEELKVNGSEFKVSEKDIIQTKSSFLDDGIIKLGFVSDIEGNLENAVKTAEIFRKEKVDAVVIAGDCYENEKIRINPVYPDSKDNVNEMIAGIKPYAFLYVPIFIIPGNHEEINVYNEAINKLKENYSNVICINKKSVDLKGFNIAGLGGYHDKRFIANGGFLLKREDYESTLNKLKEFVKQKEPILLVTHGPPNSNTKIDYVNGIGNVGDKAISYLLLQNLENIVNVHGHIHEGGGANANFGKNIAINVSSVSNYNTEGGNCAVLNFDHQNHNITVSRY